MIINPRMGNYVAKSLSSLSLIIALESEATNRKFETGGARGIGAVIAMALAENGADIAFAYLSSAEKADATVNLIEEMERRVPAIQAYSIDPEAIIGSLSEAVPEFGGIYESHMERYETYIATKCGAKYPW